MRHLYIATFSMVLMAQAIPAEARRLFINGIEASNLRQLDLKRVDLQIHENGDIYITAPHYQLTTTEQFIPLHEYMLSKPNAQLPEVRSQGPNIPPLHQAPGPIPRGHDIKSSQATPPTGLIPKTEDPQESHEPIIK